MLVANAKFEAGKTYSGRMQCNSDIIFSEKMVKRTAKFVVTEEGRRFKIHTNHNGIEFFYPHGQFSMAPRVRADFPRD